MCDRKLLRNVNRSIIAVDRYNFSEKTQEWRILSRLNPLNDYLFLKMMGESGDEEQLLSFLNAVLHRTGKGILSSIEIVNPKMVAESVGDKASILDVRAVVNDGTKTNITKRRNCHCYANR